VTITAETLTYDTEWSNETYTLTPLAGDGGVTRVAVSSTYGEVTIYTFQPLPEGGFLMLQGTDGITSVLYQFGRAPSWLHSAHR
jgi:hypothetical protein